jgi:uncharacterized protein
MGTRDETEHLRFDMNPVTRIIITMSLALGIALSTGCVPTLESQETRFYVLGALPAGTPPLKGTPNDKPLIVDLSSVTIPQYLQRPQIVTRVSQNQLVLSEFDNWGGSLEKNMLRSLAGNLSMLLATPEIHIAARRVPTGTDARVEVEVMSYEYNPDGKVHLQVQWRLVDGDRDRTPILSRVSTFTSGPITGARDIPQIVGAMTGLLGDLSTKIAEAIVAAAKR